MSWLRWMGAGVVGFGLVCAGLGFALRSTIGPVVGVLVAAMEEPEWASIEDGERYWDYLKAHPDDYSLVSYAVDASGQPIPGTELRHNGDTPRLLASTVKIVVLSAVARAVDEDALSLDEPVPLGEWDSWYLHGLDGGAHPGAYTRLEVAHTDGMANDPAATVPLEAVVGAMMRESDNAATDWLIARLGDRMHRETTLLGHDPVRSLLGDMLHAMSDAPCEGSAPDVGTPEKRKALLDAGVNPGTLSSQRAGLACTLPRGTAETYARIQAGVMTRTHISESASTWMASILEWPMDFESNQRDFEAFGTKGGCVPGVITEASYLIPKTGESAGTRRVVALFANDMSGSAWLATMASFPQQRFMVKLATEPAFASTVQSDLEAAR